MFNQVLKISDPTILQAIVDIEDKSGSNMDRALITFNNGYKLSIIRGDCSYGGPEGLFEIAPSNPKGELNGSLVSIEGDIVQGYLSAEEVAEYISKMAAL